MKTAFVATIALLAATPVHALSVVSLHAGMIAPNSSSLVETSIVIGSVLVLAAIITHRVIRSSKVK